jgi:hypothetical protein
MRLALILIPAALVVALAGCDKRTPADVPNPAPTAPTVTSAPVGVVPASSPASDPSVPPAASVVSSPASAASAP